MLTNNILVRSFISAQSWFVLWPCCFR